MKLQTHALKPLREYPTIDERREALEEALGVSLPNIGHRSLDDARAATRHCENMIGVTQIPLGVVGPLSIHTDDPQNSREVIVPLATTEGALVASVNRGCKAITMSGGAVVSVQRMGVTRGPVMKTAGIRQSNALVRWLEEHTDELRRIGASSSSHIRLLDIKPYAAGRYVFLRCRFDTGEAMGMNMVTIATSAIVHFVEEQFPGVRTIAVAGNVDIDKKPAWMNAILGRGRKVAAEATISGSVLKSVLKTDAQSIHEVWLAKCMIGSALAGSLGFNAHIANIIAALFIATGQDPAHVVEGSVGVTTTEVIPGSEGGQPDDALFISVLLPDLMVGVLGGGTALATQNEALSILGISPDGSGGGTDALASVAGGVALAGELSLLSSLAQGSLAQAHERYGRGKR